MQETRDSKDGNLFTYCLSFIRVLKHLNAPSETVKSVQSWSRSYQRGAEKQRRGDCKEALSASGKWLPWEQVLECVKSQKDCYVTADGSRPRAMEGQIYTILLMYTSIPPARSQEYWSMQWALHSEADLYAIEPEERESNWLFLSDDNQRGMLYIGRHKTSKYTGVQRIELSSAGCTSALLEQLIIFVQKERPLLVGDYTHNYLFVVRGG